MLRFVVSETYMDVLVRSPSVWSMFTACLHGALCLSKHTDNRPLFVRSQHSDTCSEEKQSSNDEEPEEQVGDAEHLLSKT